MADLYVLGHDPGLSPLVSGLLGMLRYARATTLQAVRGLSTAGLDHRHDEKSNSIGMLLAHIAAVEAWYQSQTFDDGKWTPLDASRWETALELGPEAVRDLRGKSLAEYTATLAEVRSRTERELASRGEGWLLEPRQSGDETMNHYWRWFHVCEDEINHRGQIRWLRKRLPGG